MTGKEIAKKIVDDIIAGAYSETGKLPSEGALAESFGVSRMTLRGALDEVRRQGLIEKRNGSGSFLTKRGLRRSGLIGLVIPDYEAYGFFAEIRKEVERHARLLGYRVSLVFTRERGREEAVRDIRRKVRRLAVARAEGVIFRPFVPERLGDRLFGLAGELALAGCEESVRRLDFAPGDEAAVAALMRNRRRPDAIVCGNDEQAASLLETLARVGKRVPNDVAIVGFDDIELARSTIPPLTTVSQPVRKIAATAFKSLLARIRYPNNDPREILLDARLVVRRSTK